MLVPQVPKSAALRGSGAWKVLIMPGAPRHWAIRRHYGLLNPVIFPLSGCFLTHSSTVRAAGSTGRAWLDRVGMLLYEGHTEIHAGSTSGCCLPGTSHSNNQQLAQQNERHGAAHDCVYCLRAEGVARPDNEQIITHEESDYLTNWKNRKEIRLNSSKGKVLPFGITGGAFSLNRRFTN